jgi:hypothetical protein
MADFSAPVYIPHVVAHVHHAAHVVKPHIQTVVTGVSYMTCILTSVVSFAIGAGSAWYIRGRGMAGVQIDLNNIKADVENLKSKVSGAVTFVTPTSAA